MTVTIRWTAAIQQDSCINLKRVAAITVTVTVTVLPAATALFCSGYRAWYMLQHLRYRLGAVEKF